jgi:hypothetical protein
LGSSIELAAIDPPHDRLLREIAAARQLQGEERSNPERRCEIQQARWPSVVLDAGRPLEIADVLCEKRIHQMGLLSEMSDYAAFGV